MTQTVQPMPPAQTSSSVNAIMTIQPVAPLPVTNQGESHVQNPLANLAAGTMVEGFVVNRDGQNNPILRTPIGDLRVTSDVFLKTGSQVVFKVDTSQASLARILSVDGLTPQDYTTQNTRGITQDTITPSAFQPASASLAAAGKPGQPMPGAPVLQALVLQAHPPVALTPFGGALATVQSGQLSALVQLAQLQAGTPISLTLRELKLPPTPVPLAMVAESSTLDALLPPKPNAASAAPHPATSAAATTTAHVTSPRHQEHAPIAPAQVSAPGVAAPTPQADELSPIQASLQQRAAISSAVIAAQHSPEALLAKSPLMAQQPAMPATPAQQPSPAVALSQAAPHLPQERAPAQPPQPPANAAPAPAPAQPNTPLPANQVLATVIGHEADGANILHTPVATLKLYTAQPLPTGTGLVVEVAPEVTRQQPAPATQLQADETFFTNATRDWKSLEDVIVWLKTNNPDIAREALQRLPSVDHKLASGLLFFIAAIKSGDVNEILGKRAARLLATSAPELLTKLRGDIAQIQANVVDSPLNNWTLMALPMLFGQELHQARLYVSKEPPEEKKNGNTQGRGHRFVLEIGMATLGPLQFDGFVRQQENRKSFDLVVRSNTPLPDEVNQGIRDIFSNSLEITGMRGQVLFQPGSQHFVRPLAESKAQSTGDGANTILA